MLDGFLGTRASLMMDVATVGMAVVVPMLLWSVYRVRSAKNYSLHRKIQIGLALLLLLVVGLFEAEIRIYGWRDRAQLSPYYDTWLFPVLYIHLVFAITNAILWIYMIAAALRKFGKKPQPNSYSSTHKRIGMITVFDTIMTTLTGWTFYYLAFVA